MKWRSLLILGAMLAWNAATPAGAATNKPAMKKQDSKDNACLQAIVLTTRDWNTAAATVRCYERAAAQSPWTEVFAPVPAVVGKKGMAWGAGAGGRFPAGGIIKLEGDNRAPAGMFRLHEIFGFAPPAEARITHFPYRQLLPASLGIDDPRSRYYNRIVDASRIKTPDWKTAEAMIGPRGLYRWGIVVKHNWDQTPGAGSCIFIHIWLGPGRGTSGCTAMAARNLEPIIRWLDSSKHPLLIQLPQPEYARCKPLYDWP